jgi:pre-mRNA-processing factor SLU7
MDQERRRRKLQEQAKKFQTESDPTQKRNPQSSGDNKDEQKDHKPTDDKDDEDEEGDDFKDSEKDTFSKRDPRTRTTIRNLRIREDTAKYLRNLDPNSAFYDPKSRSMRENPYLNTPLDPTKGGQSDVTYFGDNFVRVSGDVGKFYEIQRFAWEAYESGKDVHLQAVPSATEQIFHEHKQQKEVQQKKLKETLLQQYGGREYLEIPKELDLAQTEHYVEYTPDGQILQVRSL